MSDGVMEKVAEYVRGRNAAFEADDVGWFADKLPPDVPMSLMEDSFHRARLVCCDVSDEKRLESQKWLADRGAHYFDLVTPIKVGDRLVRMEMRLENTK